MKIKFVGGIGRVTGSCTWLKSNDAEFLVDCGMIQGETNADFDNGQQFPFDPQKLKFVLLTHAHLDHCGLIPKLYKDGFHGKVFAMKATSKLAREIMMDASGIGAPYKKEDVQKVQYEHFDVRREFKWGTLLPIDKDLFVGLYRNAHILGSVSINIVWGKEKYKNIWFTGDIGNSTRDNPTHSLLKPRHNIRNDVGNIVCESTYGGRSHDFIGDIESRTKQLEKHIIKTIYKDGGNLIIPAFTLHRTQELLFDLFYLFSTSEKLGGVKSGIPVGYLQKKLLISKRNGWLRSTFGRIIDEIRDEGVLGLSLIPSLEECYPYHFKIPLEERAKLQVAASSPEVSKNIDKYLVEEGNYFCYEHDESKTNSDVLESFIKLFTEVGLENKIHAKLDREKLMNFLSSHSGKAKTTRGHKVEPIQVFLDSPLAKKITKIYAEELSTVYYNGQIIKPPYLNDSIKDLIAGGQEEESAAILNELFSTKKVHIGLHTFQWVAPNNALPPGPKIVISSSGMCSEGPILKHLGQNLTDEKNAILLSGFTSSGTNGSILGDLEKMGDDEKSILSIQCASKTIPCKSIKSTVSRLVGYSGHADHEGLLDYLFPQSEDDQFNATAPYIFLNHGSDDARETLAQSIAERSVELMEKYEGKYPYNTEVVIPTRNDGWFDLETHQWIEEQITAGATNEESAELIDTMRNLTTAINRLTDVLLSKQDMNSV